jgi:hypothetical protein
MCGVVWAELTGRMPFHAWQLAITLALPAIMLLAAVSRKFDKAESFRIPHPQHVSEVAAAIHSISDLCRELESEGIANTVPVARTSAGFQFSAGGIHGNENVPTHFTISHRSEHVSEKAADSMAQLIMQLTPDFTKRELIPGLEKGVFHLLLAPAGMTGERS